jgi:hypothetical protein
MTAFPNDHYTHGAYLVGYVTEGEEDHPPEVTLVTPKLLSPGVYLGPGGIINFLATQGIVVKWLLPSPRPPMTVEQRQEDA